MDKQTLIKIGLITAMILVCGLAWRAQARWSTTVSIKNNNVRTGSVSLTVNPSESWLSIDGLMPSQQIERLVSITNTGSAPVSLSLTAKKSAGYTAVMTNLNCLLIDQNGETVFSGKLSELNQSKINPQLDSGSMQQYTVRLSLPEDASAEAANSYANITFELVGEQV
jgi:hypothetical protein